MTEKNFYKLMDSDLVDLSIVKDSVYNCIIRDTKGNIYEGFLLAESAAGKAKTICEVDFTKSKTDGKYHPRLTFKRTDGSFREKKVTGEALTQRISFQERQDGYIEFWKMISFLKGFGDLIDTGSFEQEYRVVSHDEVTKFIDGEDEATIKKIIEGLGVVSASSLHIFSTIKLLKEYKKFFEYLIKEKATETDVQKWIDEDNHIHRQDRCMIFGLEFLNHKREGGAVGNKYDILTRIGVESEERVLFELKSPSVEVFSVKKKGTINDPKNEYSLSSSLARAIPQILEYRRDIEEKRAGDSELEKIGERGEVKISKCIIVIGSEIDDERWKKNLRELRRSLSSNLEIWTYTDLLHKIKSVIKNLENRNQQS